MNKFIRVAVIVLIAGQVASVWSDSQKLYGKDPVEILSKSDYVLYAAKASGAPVFAEYAEYFYGTMKDEAIGDNWLSLVRDIDEKFYVIQVIQGEEFSPGDVIEIKNKYQEFMGTFVGHDYVLFIEDENGSLYYDRCGAANLRRLSKEERDRILALPKKMLISELIDKYLMICLEEEVQGE